MPNTDRDKKNKTNNEYYHRNKERILEKMQWDSKEYYEKNKERISEAGKKSRSSNYEQHLLSSVKNRCKNRTGIECSITLEDIVIPEMCPYLNIPLTRIQGQGKVWSNASVDRIDPSKGYVKGNIQIISNKANMMKHNATHEELITFAKNVLFLEAKLT
jgi:hypothetical protein